MSGDISLRCCDAGCNGNHYGLTADEFHDLAEYNGWRSCGLNVGEPLRPDGDLDREHRMMLLQHRYDSYTFGDE